MHRVIGFHQVENWMEVIGSFRETDVYYYPGYLKPFAENGDGEPLLFFFESEYGKAANVFLLRDIWKDRRLQGAISRNHFFDISTVYGYGGPVFETRNLRELAKGYQAEFQEFCRERGIVADFIRFHPVLKNQVFLEDHYQVENIRSTVCVDLRFGEQHVWDHLESNCKRNVKKAAKCGIQIISGTDRRLLEEFMSLYAQTMRRDKASDYFHFDSRFFHTTMDALGKHAVIFAAALDSKIIAACIVLHTERAAHYHFAGSDMEYQGFRPNNLLIYEIARWGCREGKQILHLGGGLKGDEDNLYRFKKSFSKEIPLSFHIGKKIYDQAAYEKLTAIRAAEETYSGTGFFPLYRS